MTKEMLFSLAGIGGACLIHPGCKTGYEKQEGAKPNIIFILADDMGSGDLSCYGQTSFTTNNIDRLAANGLLFTRHYAGCTVSAPSRASLLTGKHTGHNSVRVNLNNLIDDSEITIADVLKESGYYTGLIGKWGIGNPPPDDDPARKGFDEAYGYINMWHAHNYFPDFLVRNGSVEKIEGNVIGDYVAMTTWDEPKPAGVGYSVNRVHYSHDLLENEALKFIDNHKDTTFFLFLPFTIPHANNEADNGMEIPGYGKFSGREWPDTEKGFASMINRLDSTVGLILDKLQKAGIAQNTLIFFTSDNGPHMEGGHRVDFFNSNGKLRGNKRDLYEGGIRVPLIAYWPEKIKPGTITNHISSFWDILPTFCDIAGHEIPSDIDGISFLPLLLGKTQEQKKHDYLYWEFYEDNGKQAVLTDNYKGIFLNLRQEPVFELYDLKIDESEEINIASKHPEIETRMKKIMKESHSPFYIPLNEYSKYYPAGKKRQF